MAKKEFVFNQFYYNTVRVDFEKREVIAESERLVVIAQKDPFRCQIRYDIAGDEGDGGMMIKIDSRFYVKPPYSVDHNGKLDNERPYSVYDGKSVFQLDNEYPATFDDSDFHSNNGTVWDWGVTLAELTFQHLSKHVGCIYEQTWNVILFEIPSTYGIYLNLFKEGFKKNEWIVLEETFFDEVKLAKLMSKDECERGFENLKNMGN